MDVYVFCFCEDGDLLSQWRGYAQGGDGYSIGVNVEPFFESGFRGNKFFFGKVEYARAQQEQIIGTIITMILDGLTRLTQGMSLKEANPTIDQCCEVFRQSLWIFLTTFKNSMFSSENEWRAMCLLMKEETIQRVQFRSSGSKLIPYIEINFSSPEKASSPSIPISRVYHGPTLNPELSKSCLKLMLQKHRYSHIEVLGSQIPLRV